MFIFNDAQKMRALRRLVFWHIVIIAASNYLVQFPFTIWGISNTWGAFTFPFIFLTTDLTVRIFGQSMARKIIFWAMFPALLLSYVISVAFQNGTWTGQFFIWDIFVFRIAFASFAAYAVGQLLDITVFNRLRRLKQWYIAPASSTVLGSAADGAVFFFVAFYHSTDPFMAANWIPIACADYAVKIFISTLFFLPAYGVVLNILSRRIAFA